jgi:hypothetical protein
MIYIRVKMVLRKGKLPFLALGQNVEIHIKMDTLRHILVSYFKCISIN